MSSFNAGYQQGKINARMKQSNQHFLLYQQHTISFINWIWRKLWFSYKMRVLQFATQRQRQQWTASYKEQKSDWTSGPRLCVIISGIHKRSKTSS